MLILLTVYTDDGSSETFADVFKVPSSVSQIRLSETLHFKFCPWTYQKSQCVAPFPDGGMLYPDIPHALFAVWCGADGGPGVTSVKTSGPITISRR